MVMRQVRYSCILASLGILLLLCGCANISVTKTAQGYLEPTKPDTIDILTMKPERPFQELATIAVYKWNPKNTAKLHNALRAKSAPLGANAVVLLNSGINTDGYATYLWATGVAIRYKD